MSLSEETQEIEQAVETAQPDSVSSDIHAALEAYKAKVAEPVEKAEPTEKADETEEQRRARDEKGRFATKTDPVEKKEPAQAEATEQATEQKPEGAQPPIHWSADDKALIAKLPPDMQGAVIDRFKKMEAGFAPKLQEAAELKRSWGEVDAFLKPHAADIQARGMSVPQLVKSWAQVEQALMQNPAAAVQKIAQAYGVDLAAIATGQQQAADRGEVVIPPVVQQKLQTLEEKLAARERAEQEAALNATMKTIESFATQKSEAGDLAHPHFADVMDDMLALAAAERAAGKTPDLKALYDRAVYANPVTRDKLFAARLEAEQKKRAEDQKAKAVQARKAGSSVSGAPGASAASKPRGSVGSVQDDIRAAIESVRG